jgi:hypothetical protein
MPSNGYDVRFTLVSFPYYNLICSVLYYPVHQIIAKHTRQHNLAWADPIVVRGMFGQDYLRPYPKAATLSLMSGFGLPSFRNLSGRTSSGSGDPSELGHVGWTPSH